MSQPPPPVLGALAARYTASAGSFASGAAAAAAPPPPPTAHGHMPPAKRQRQGDGGAVVPVPSYNAAGKRDDLWSETDDQEVMASAAKHPSQGSGSRWEKISAEVSAQTGKLRAPKSCRSRHARVLANRKKAAQGLQPDPNAATGLWTPEQDRQLRQLVTQHGTIWSQIGPVMKREPHACRGRWRRMKLKEAGKKKYSDPVNAAAAGQMQYSLEPAIAAASLPIYAQVLPAGGGGMQQPQQPPQHPALAPVHAAMQHQPQPPQHQRPPLPPPVAQQQPAPMPPPVQQQPQQFVQHVVQAAVLQTLPTTVAAAEAEAMAGFVMAKTSLLGRPRE